MTGQTHLLMERLDALRTELADLAFTLERRGDSTLRMWRSRFPRA